MANEKAERAANWAGGIAGLGAAIATIAVMPVVLPAVPFIGAALAGSAMGTKVGKAAAKYVGVQVAKHTERVVRNKL